MNTGQLTGGTARVVPSPSSGAAARPAHRRFSLRQRRAWAFYAFTGPWVLGFLTLTAYPLGYALWLSFTNSDGLSRRTRFVGLANYKEVFSDPDTLASLGRTALFTGITLPLSIVAGLLLAVLVNQPIRARGLFRTLLYLPAVVPPVGAALTFKLIFDRDSGSANGLLDVLHINGVPWLIDPYARWVLIVLTMWGVGNVMIVSLAGLQDVPKELLEAARVDGASSWQSFTRITLPLLSPVIFFQVVTGVIGSLQSLAPLLVALNPTPAGVTSVPQSNYFYMINVIAQFFANGRYGYASAMLWVLFAIIIAVTFLLFKVSKGAVFYSVETEPEKNRPRRMGDA